MANRPSNVPVEWGSPGDGGFPAFQKACGSSWKSKDDKWKWQHFGVVPTTKSKNKTAKVEEVLKVEITAMADPDSQPQKGADIRKSGLLSNLGESDSQRL